MAYFDVFNGDADGICSLPQLRLVEPRAALLARGVRVDYFDHHYAGDVPRHPLLRVAIDTSASVCTGILVDRYLEGRARRWAVVAAFGDALDDEARVLARSAGLAEVDIDALREVGEAFAYNAYGDVETDLIVAPVSLYRALDGYADPLDFAAGSDLLQAIDASR